jgi:glycosyltransferase involved in cell wall biosynthesis
MKIIYLSCHSILEHNEITLFHELGYEVFSPGAYWHPQEGDGSRPGIPGLKYKQEWIDAYNDIGQRFPGAEGKEHLSKELVDMFDVVICMHQPHWIQKNWKVLKDKRVIWRTIGQSVASTEQFMAPYRKRGVEVVRYSPREVNIPHFCGQDGMIRFYKDPKIYCDWNGKKKNVITFCQNMEQRGTSCGYQVFDRVTAPFPRKLFGPGNEQPGLGVGKVSFERQLRELRDNRVFFYTGTHPASYTLGFMEALMTGTPIVAVGPLWGNANHLRNHNLYEVHHLIEDGVSGFISDDFDVLQEKIKLLFKNRAVAEEVSENGRKLALRHFNKEPIKAAWKAYLER